MSWIEKDGYFKPKNNEYRPQNGVFESKNRRLDGLNFLGTFSTLDFLLETSNLWFLSKNPIFLILHNFNQFLSFLMPKKSDKPEKCKKTQKLPKQKT